MEEPQAPPKKRGSQMSSEGLNIYNTDNLVVETKDELKNKTEDIKEKNIIKKQEQENHNETVIKEKKQEKKY